MINCKQCGGLLVPGNPEYSQERAEKYDTCTLYPKCGETKNPEQQKKWKNKALIRAMYVRPEYRHNLSTLQQRYGVLSDHIGHPSNEEVVRSDDIRLRNVEVQLKSGMSEYEFKKFMLSRIEKEWSNMDPDTTVKLSTALDRYALMCYHGTAAKHWTMDVIENTLLGVQAE